MLRVRLELGLDQDRFGKFRVTSGQVRSSMGWVRLG